jgi:hypothetical protein
MLESTDIGESLERLLGDFDNLNAPTTRRIFFRS